MQVDLPGLITACRIFFEPLRARRQNLPVLRGLALKAQRQQKNSGDCRHGGNTGGFLLLPDGYRRGQTFEMFRATATYESGTASRDGP